MKLAAALLLAGAIAFPSVAKAQSECNSTLNLATISNSTFGASGGLVLLTNLSDSKKTEFYVWADPYSPGAFIWGLTDVTEWSSMSVSLDANGNYIVDWDDCGFFLQCDEDGGVYVSVEGPDIPQQTFNISSAGVVTEVPAKPACGCSGTGGTWTPCSVTMCNNTAACRTGGTGGYCQNGTQPNDD